MYKIMLKKLTISQKYYVNEGRSAALFFNHMFANDNVLKPLSAI